MKKIIFILFILASCQKGEVMPIIEPIKVNVSSCNEGAYIRWYFNGWNYELFSDRYTTEEVSSVNGVQIVEVFSAISKVEKNTSRKSRIFIQVGADNIAPSSVERYKGLLIAETVEIYQLGQWVELEVERKSFTIRPTKLNRFNIEFRAEVKKIITTGLIVPPTEQPVSLWELNENFTNWGGSPPYSQVPTNWTSVFTPNVDLYCEPITGGIRFHKSNTLPENYTKTPFIKYDILTNHGRLITGNAKVEINITDITSNSPTNPYVQFFFRTSNIKSYNVEGKYTVYFSGLTGERYLYVGLYRIYTGTHSCDIEYIKVTQL